MIAVTALWAIECHSLNVELSDDLGAAYALTFAVQTVLVGGLLLTTRLGTWLIRRHRHDLEKPEWRVQFGVGLMLSWIAAIAVVLCAWRQVRIHTGWSLDVVKGAYFLFGGVVGAYNAVFALMVLASVRWGQQWYRTLARLAGAGIGLAVASSQSIASQALFGLHGGVQMTQWMALAGFQALYLLITVVPMWQCGNDQQRRSTHGTSSCLAAHHTGIPDTA